jgi:sulfur-oxidizing protein SoxY
MNARGAPRASRLSRRGLLAGALGVLAGSARAQLTEGAAPGPFSPLAQRAIAQVLQGRSAHSARVHLEIPRLAENGLAVPLTVRVDSPMSAADHVRTLHLIAPANPLPQLARLHFGPRSGEAYLSTRIRLADSQHVLAFAEVT